MKKLFVSSLLLAATLFSVSANSNSKAIEYFKFGLNNAAKKMLQEELNSGKLTPQEKAEAYYYLGEIAFAEQDKIAAAENYKKSEAADVTFVLNKIGQPKLLLATNALQAEKDLAAIVKSNKKNMAVQVAVARTYLDNNMLEKAAKQIADAKKVNDKYAALYVLEGDLKAQDFRQTGIQSKVAEATALYERAIYFDKQSKEAYAKYARVFTQLNPGAAIAKLQELAEVDKSSQLAYREIGEVYFQNKQYENAAEAYEKYIANDKYSVSDFFNYAIILFYKGDYNKSLEVINKALAVDKDNIALNRYAVYNNAKLKTPDALAIAEKFINTTPAQNLVAQDYIYYAQLLKEQKRDNDAIAQFEKAFQMDTTNVMIYKELGDVYFAAGNFDKAIENYNFFITKGDTQVKGNDYIYLGLSYYNAAADDKIDAAKKELYVIGGDSAFAYVAEKASNSYFGNFWRARVQTLLDPKREKGLAKPYYEAAAEILSKDTTKNTKELVECYDYLGYYYMLQAEKTKNTNDIKTSKSYWQKIIELDPNNANAKNVLKKL